MRLPRVHQTVDLFFLPTNNFVPWINRLLMQNFFISCKILLLNFFRLMLRFSGLSFFTFFSFFNRWISIILFGFFNFAFSYTSELVTVIVQNVASIDFGILARGASWCLRCVCTVNWTNTFVANLAEVWVVTTPFVHLMATFQLVSCEKLNLVSTVITIIVLVYGLVVLVVSAKRFVPQLDLSFIDTIWDTLFTV